MAKRKLKSPDVPPGARRNFFMEMQRLVLENGDKSTAALASSVHVSYQTVYKALTGPKMPSRPLTEALGEALGGPSGAKVALEHWTYGVAEERSELAPPTTANADSDAPAPPPDNADPVERSAAVGRSPNKGIEETSDIPQEVYQGRRRRVSAPRTPPVEVDTGASDPRWRHPDLSPQEQAVLNLVAMGHPTDEVAKRLILSPSTIRTILQRIRKKYARINRPAVSRADLAIRAIQDGFIESVIQIDGPHGVTTVSERDFFPKPHSSQ